MEEAITKKARQKPLMFHVWLNIKWCGISVVLSTVVISFLPVHIQKCSVEDESISHGCKSYLTNSPRGKLIRLAYEMEGVTDNYS